MAGKAILRRLPLQMLVQMRKREETHGFGTGTPQKPCLLQESGVVIVRPEASQFRISDDKARKVSQVRTIAPAS
jgi:hypothetical protein